MGDFKNEVLLPTSNDFMATLIESSKFLEAIEIVAL